jgi:hypothetical protein
MLIVGHEKGVTVIENRNVEKLQVHCPSRCLPVALLTGLDPDSIIFLIRFQKKRR